MADIPNRATVSWGDDLSDELDSVNTADTSRLLEPENFRQTQERLIAAQNQGLDRLTEAVKRQKMMAHGIATEVDVHNELLDEIDDGMTNTNLNLRRNTNNIKLLSRRSGTCFYWTLIILLMIVIITLSII